MRQVAAFIVRLSLQLPGLGGSFPPRQRYVGGPDSGGQEVPSEGSHWDLGSHRERI